MGTRIHAPRRPPRPAVLQRWLSPLVLAALLLNALALLLNGCSRPAADPPAETAQGVVDSIFPIAEEIRRFAASVDSVPVALRGGAPNRDALVAAFIRAVETRDTLAFASLVLQRDEFIGVYYPHTEFTHPPYELSPALLWFQMQNRSSRGMFRLLQRDAGHPLGFRQYRCDAPPRVQGEYRLWEGCLLVLADSGGGTRERRLFGGILEHRGVYKFLTYANEY